MVPGLAIFTEAIARNLSKDGSTLPSPTLTHTPKFGQLSSPELFALEADLEKRRTWALFNQTARKTTKGLQVVHKLHKLRRKWLPGQSQNKSGKRGCFCVCYPVSTLLHTYNNSMKTTHLPGSNQRALGTAREAKVAPSPEAHTYREAKKGKTEREESSCQWKACSSLKPRW